MGSFFSEFVPFDAGRKVKFNPSHFVVIPQETETNPVVPLFCEKCRFPLRSVADRISYKSYGCCQACELAFYRILGKDWTPGTGQEKEAWEQYVKSRQSSWRGPIRFG